MSLSNLLARKCGCSNSYFFDQQMGAYHTIDLELNRKFTLLKEYWDIIALERVGKFDTSEIINLW